MKKMTNGNTSFMPATMQPKILTRFTLKGGGYAMSIIEKLAVIKAVKKQALHLGFFAFAEHCKHIETEFKFRLSAQKHSC